MWFNCRRSHATGRRRPPSACNLRTAYPPPAAGRSFLGLETYHELSPHQHNITAKTSYVRSLIVAHQKLVSQNKPERLTHIPKRLTHRCSKKKSNICYNEVGSARRFLRVMLREIGVHHGDTDVPCSLLHYHYVRFGRYRPNPTREKVSQEDDVRKLEQPGGHLAAKQSDKHHPQVVA